MKRKLLILALFLSYFAFGFAKPIYNYEFINIDQNERTNLYQYLSQTTKNILVEKQESNNPIYSPLSVLFTLSMMAETVSEEVQTEILQYLHCETMDDLRNINKQILNSFLNNKIAEEFNLENISFRDEDVSTLFNQEIINTLKNSYNAKDYVIDLQSEGANRISSEIKDNTNGFLDVSPIEIARYIRNDSVNVLMNIIYFKDDWAKKFSKSEIQKKDFYQNNTSVSIDTLVGEQSGFYYEDEYLQFGTIDFKNGSSMYFILPKDNYSIEDCLNKNIIEKYLHNELPIERYNINYQIPKFDVSYQFDLTEILKNSGLIKTYSIRDDSPFFSNSFGYYQTVQSSRILLDENGVKAATVTFSMGCSSAAPMNSVNLFLNKPFVYYILNPDNIIMFSGIINHF